MKQHHIGWSVVVAAILFALWLLFSKKGQVVTQGATTVALGGTDPITGCPIFNSSVQTPPGSPVAPITGNVNDPIDNYPSDPTKASCPDGYMLMKDAVTNAYFCFPVNG